MSKVMIDHEHTTLCPQCYAPTELHYDAHTDCAWTVCLTIGCDWSQILEDRAQ